MREAVLRCVRCGSEYPVSYELTFCPKCGGLLEVVPSLVEGLTWDRLRLRMPGVWRYREFLPRVSRIVSLGEGWTPLVRADALGARVWVKFEGANPTGSFKDRGMTVGVSVALEAGAKVVGAASTGNTSASLAAYAARAGLRSVVLLPRGKVARGKVAQAILHGAEIIEVNGSFDDALAILMEAASRGILYPLNSFNPWRLEGQKTIAFEIADAMEGMVPGYVFVPVGNAGNISAIWKGFKELVEAGLLKETPRMVGVQAEGAAPLAEAWARGLNEPVWFEKPETIATAIRIGRPVNWPKAMRAVRESGGWFMKVSDDEIRDAQLLLARRVGLGVEPASAAALAGYLKALKDGMIDSQDSAVLIATGHALKDPDIAAEAPTVLRKANGFDEALELLLRGLAQ